MGKNVSKHFGKALGQLGNEGLWISSSRVHRFLLDIMSEVGFNGGCLTAALFNIAFPTQHLDRNLNS
jgi:hypothetical protein